MRLPDFGDTPDATVSLDEAVDETVRFRRDVRDNHGACGEVSNWVHGRFGWPMVRGFLEDPYGGPGPHCFNLLPNGGLFDGTSDQYGWEEQFYVDPADDRHDAYCLNDLTEGYSIDTLRESNYFDDHCSLVRTGENEHGPFMQLRVHPHRADESLFAPDEKPWSTREWWPPSVPPRHVELHYDCQHHPGATPPVKGVAITHFRVARRGNGYGSSVMNAFLAHLKDQGGDYVTLKMKTPNTRRARGFADKFGFTVDDDRTTDERLSATRSLDGPVQPTSPGAVEYTR